MKQQTKHEQLTYRIGVLNDANLQALESNRMDMAAIFSMGLKKLRLDLYCMTVEEAGRFV
jgi:hypothetical protein